MTNDTKHPALMKALKIGRHAWLILGPFLLIILLGLSGCEMGKIGKLRLPEAPTSSETNPAPTE